MADASHGAEGRRYADELRGRIDRGQTGDKVNYPDPAAAPLGTDDEAAGTTPAPMQVNRALAQETGRETAPQVTSAGGSTLLEGGPAYALSGLIAVATIIVLFFAITHMR